MVTGYVFSTISLFKRLFPAFLQVHEHTIKANNLARYDLHTALGSTRVYNMQKPQQHCTGAEKEPWVTCSSLVLTTYALDLVITSGNNDLIVTLDHQGLVAFVSTLCLRRLSPGFVDAHDAVLLVCGLPAWEGNRTRSG